MYGFEFQSKLRRLNSKLFLDERAASPIEGVPDRPQVSILYKQGEREDKKTNYLGLGTEGIRFLRDVESGHTYKHISGCATQWIPEFDEFSWNGDRLVLSARGWRTIGKILVNHGICSAERFRRVFSCPSFLESSYDWAGYELRFEWAIRELEKATGHNRRIMFMRTMPKRLSSVGLEW